MSGTQRQHTPSLATKAFQMAMASVEHEQRHPRTDIPADLAAFGHTVKPDYEESRVTRLMSSELEGLERGDTRRLLIFVPPREGKSLHASELYPAWALGQNPRLQFILSSYNDDLAERNSRAVKDLVESELWPFSDCKVRGDVKAVSHWQTTRGGIIRAAGVGGGATGYGADRLIIDDYLKNRDEAMSQTLRDRCWDWYTTVARTRLMPGGRQLIVATRWHEDDLAGRILNSKAAKDWRVVSLPMECDSVNDQLGRRMGEFLNGRIPQIEVPKVALGEISPTDYAAMYQQHPVALTGNMFKRDWWGTYDRDELIAEGLRPMVITVDTAFKLDPINDFSVGAVWGLFRDRAYLMDLWRERVAFNDLIHRLHGLYETWHVPLMIEDRASGQSAIQVLSSSHQLDVAPGDQEAFRDVMTELRISAPRIPIFTFKIPRYSTNITRALMAVPYVASQVCYLPKGEPWVEAFIEEHARFPSGAHDDQVCTTAMALPKLFAHKTAQEQGATQSRWSIYRLGPGFAGAGDRSGGDLAKELFR